MEAESLATELHHAAVKGDVNATRKAIEKGANVDAKDEFGWTPLLRAVATKNKELVDFLISKGANVNAKNTSDGTTVIGYACMWGEENKSIVELLLSKGARLNVTDGAGRTPLFVPVMGGNLSIVELLLSKGIDVNSKDRNGQTALSFAEQNGNQEMIELLKKHGAK